LIHGLYAHPIGHEAGIAQQKERYVEVQRWFTPEQGTDLVISSEEFTDVEKASLAAILAYARDPSNVDMELMHCLDTAGTNLIDTSVGYKSAEVTDKMRNAIEAGCARMWHNHPSRGSISDSDWMLAGCTERTEILAVTVSETIYVGRMMEWPDSFDAVMGENFRRIAGDLDNVLQQHTLANETFNERLDSAHLDGHLLNLSLAYCGVVRYAALLSSEDAKAMADADRVGLVAEGRRWANQQIRDALARHSAVSSN